MRSLVSILLNKAAQIGGSVTKVSTFETKASQFDHTDESYTKKKLSERTAKLSDGNIVQRDPYSAFLLCNLNKTNTGYNTKALKEEFPEFKKLQDNMIQRLKNDKIIPSSMRI